MSAFILFCVFYWYTWVGSCIIPWPLPCLSSYCFFCHCNIVLYHHCSLLFKHQIIETFTMMMIFKLTNYVNSLQCWNIKLTRERCGNHDGLLCEALLWTWTMNFKCAIQTLFLFRSLCLRYTFLYVGTLKGPYESCILRFMKWLLSEQPNAFNSLRILDFTVFLTYWWLLWLHMP
jgi:hypothetical protein